jgi:hypothetical protein
MASNAQPEVPVVEALSRVEAGLITRLDRLAEAGGGETRSRQEARAWAAFALFVAAGLTVIACLV